MHFKRNNGKVYILNGINAVWIYYESYLVNSHLCTTNIKTTQKG